MNTARSDNTNTRASALKGMEGVTYPRRAAALTAKPCRPATAIAGCKSLADLKHGSNESRCGTHPHLIPSAHPGRTAFEIDDYFNVQRVVELALSADGRWLARASSSPSLSVFDLSSAIPTPHAIIAKAADRVASSVAVSPDGTFVAVAFHQSDEVEPVRVWRITKEGLQPGDSHGCRLLRCFQSGRKDVGGRAQGGAQPARSDAAGSRGAAEIAGAPADGRVEPTVCL